MKRRFTDVAQFREFFIVTFMSQQDMGAAVAHPYDSAKLKITIGERELTGDLTNIFGYINSYPDEDADQLIERFIRSLTFAGSSMVEDGRIVAVIRTRDYIDFLLAKGLDVLFEPLCADLMITYMADQPDSMSPLTSKAVPGKDLQTVRKIALDNVRQWLPKVISDDQLQSCILYFVQGNTMLSTSLVLIDEFWDSIKARFPGDVLIALPRRDQLFIFGDGNPAVKRLARHLIDVTTQENFNLLSQDLFARRGDKIVLVTD